MNRWTHPTLTRREAPPPQRAIKNSSQTAVGMENVAESDATDGLGFGVGTDGDLSMVRRAYGRITRNACIPAFPQAPAGLPTFDVIPTSHPAARAFWTQSDAVRSGTSNSRAMSFTGGRSARAAVP